MIQSINVTQYIIQFSYKIVCACQCPVVHVQKLQLQVNTIPLIMVKT